MRPREFRKIQSTVLLATSLKISSSYFSPSQRIISHLQSFGEHIVKIHRGSVVNVFSSLQWSPNATTFLFPNLNWLCNTPLVVKEHSFMLTCQLSLMMFLKWGFMCSSYSYANLVYLIQGQAFSSHRVVYTVLQTGNVSSEVSIVQSLFTYLFIYLFVVSVF